MPVKVSQAFTKGAIVSVPITGSDRGTAIPATSSTAVITHLGVIKKTIASTDSDYATARKVPIEVPLEKGVEWEADVTSGLTTSDIGLEVDLTDSLVINRDASSIKVAIVRDYLTATRGVVILKLNGAY